MSWKLIFGVSLLASSVSGRPELHVCLEPKEELRKMVFVNYKTRALFMYMCVCVLFLFCFPFSFPFLFSLKLETYMNLLNTGGKNEVNES